MYYKMRSILIGWLILTNKKENNEKQKNKKQKKNEISICIKCNSSEINIER